MITIPAHRAAEIPLSRDEASAIEVGLLSRDDDYNADGREEIKGVWMMRAAHLARMGTTETVINGVTERHSNVPNNNNNNRRGDG
jgi:hypothetical protein